jgi:hypothetical protein
MGTPACIARADATAALIALELSRPSVKTIIAFSPGESETDSLDPAMASKSPVAPLAR